MLGFLCVPSQVSQSRWWTPANPWKNPCRLPPQRRLAPLATAAGREEGVEKQVNVVLAHTQADFDSLASAVGLARVWQDEQRDCPTYVCVPRGAHPVVQHFLALHKSRFPVIELRDIRPETLRRVGMVDAQRLDRVGPARFIVEAAKEVFIYDHHMTDGAAVSNTDANATMVVIEKVGSVTTIVVELLRARGLTLPPEDATLMCLGIHSDTGSLTYDSSTARDAHALAWLMEQGASQQAIAEYGHAALSREQQATMFDAFQNLNKTLHNGAVIATTLVTCDGYVNGMARVAQNMMDATDADVLLLGVNYSQKLGREKTQMAVIGRARARASSIHLDHLFSAYGGGGHAKAASASFKLDDAKLPGAGRLSAQDIMEELAAKVRNMVRVEEVAADIMTAPVLTCSPDALMDEVGGLLERYDIRGLPVVSSDRKVVGMVSHREVARARAAGKQSTPVKGWMLPHFVHATTRQPLHELEDLLVQSDAGRLPVLSESGQLEGLITRSDVLRQHRYYDEHNVYENRPFADPIDSPQRRLLAELRKKLKRFDD